MMKNTLLLILISSLIFNINTIIAQQSSIHAIILDTNHQKINGNYILIDTAGKYIQGNYFESGMINFSTSFVGLAKFKVIAFGYKSFETLINIQLQEIDLATIIMQSTNISLKEITIKAEHPIFEKTMDGTKINIENTLLSKSANSRELLSRIPTVSINANQVNVLGKGEALIIINGKVTTLESFKSIAPADIKSIEVITNPDARYDAKGKAVILVTMNKYYSQGLSIMLVNATTIGLVKTKPFAKYTVNSPNITINIRKNKWDFTGYYANEYGTNWSENKFITQVKSNNELYKKVGYYTEDNHNKSVHNYLMGVGYKINDKASLSLQYDGLSQYFTLDVKQNANYYAPDNSLTIIHMKNDASTRLQNHSVNLNYNQLIDSNGSNLFIGVQYNRFQNKLLDQITEEINDSVKTQIHYRMNKGLNEINLYTFQTDYSHNFNKSSIDIGAKVAYNSNDGSIHFYSKEANQQEYIENNIYANGTLYKEWIPAIYAIYKMKIKNFNFQAGVRWEHTFANGISKKYNTTLINASYSNFFPSVKMFYTIKQNWKLIASYNYKINRPLYQDLDPFLWYLDSLTSIQGNSKLVPEYLHQCEAKVMFKNYTLRYSFTLSNKTIAAVLKQGINGVNSVVFTKDNIQHRTIHIIAFEIPIEKNNYSSYNTIAMNFYQFNDNRSTYKAIKNSPQLYIYSYHSYKIPKWFTTEFTAEFYSRSVDGFTQRKPNFYFTLALNRSFFKDESLNISLMWNDFARTASWAGKFQVNTYSNEYNQRFTTDYLRLTITYNLNSKTQFAYKNKNVNEADYNRIKK